MRILLVRMNEVAVVAQNHADILCRLSNPAEFVGYRDIVL
jgi:hypothetical protein